MLKRTWRIERQVTRIAVWEWSHSFQIENLTGWKLKNAIKIGKEIKWSTSSSFWESLVRKYCQK